MKRYLLLLVGVILGTLTASLSAADKEPANTQEDKRSEAVASIAKAAQMASFGRGEMTEDTVLGKSFKSPELLVAAGGLLMQAAGVLGDEMDTVNDKGDVVKSPKTKPVSLKTQAKDLFDEAIAMVGNDKAKAKELNALIAKASVVPESRGAVGRPRTVVRTLNPGESVTITIGFVPSSPATVSYSTVGGPRQRCEIITPNGNSIYDNTAASGSHSWRTAQDSNKRLITIRLTNLGNKAHTVTVTTN